MQGEMINACGALSCICTQVRRLRTQLRNGQLTQAEYEAQIDRQIAYAVGVQDALGLDVLVHGEPERTDMVRLLRQSSVCIHRGVHVRMGWLVGDSSASLTESSVTQHLQILTCVPCRGTLTKLTRPAASGLLFLCDRFGCTTLGLVLLLLFVILCTIQIALHRSHAL
jgi:Cobalamin-independent synthase, Catalytic domain